LVPYSVEPHADIDRHRGDGSKWTIKTRKLSFFVIYIGFLSFIVIPRVVSFCSPPPRKPKPLLRAPPAENQWMQTRQRLLFQRNAGVGRAYLPRRQLRPYHKGLSIQRPRHMLVENEPRNLLALISLLGGRVDDLYLSGFNTAKTIEEDAPTSGLTNLLQVH